MDAEEKTRAESGLFDWSRLSNYVAIVVLVISFSVSLWRVYRVQEVEQSDQGATIRVVHWQLEAGFREAFDDIARRFERLLRGDGPASPRGAKRHLGARLQASVQTQGIGRSLPDLVQLGREEAGSVPRFFIGNTEDAKTESLQPGDGFGDVPWMDTYMDGMVDPSTSRLGILRCSLARFLSACFTIANCCKPRPRRTSEQLPRLDLCRRFGEWAQREAVRT